MFENVIGSDDVSNVFTQVTADGDVTLSPTRLPPRLTEDEADNKYIRLKPKSM